ncbi:MAG: glycoside hydrolase family 5, partial [Planctomycetota bacterium]
MNRYFWIVLVCVIIGMSSTAKVAAEQAAIQLPTLTVANGFGVNIHFRGEPRDLDLIFDAGF